MTTAFIEAEIHNPAEIIRKEFLKCVSAVADFRKLFQKLPKSERAQNTILHDYHLFAIGYNSGGKAINKFEKPDELYKFPEDFVELARLFGFKHDTVFGGWKYIVHMLNEESISGVYQDEKEYNMNYAIHGTLALVKVILDSTKESDKQRILSLIREIQKGIGGNLKSLKQSGDMTEFEHLSHRIQEQLKEKGLKYDEYEVAKIIQQLTPIIEQAKIDIK